VSLYSGRIHGPAIDVLIAGLTVLALRYFFDSRARANGNAKGAKTPRIR
jgi:hypothetical protein